MKKLGKIPFPEQYAPVGKEVRISNSVEALAFFENLHPAGGIVLLGSMRLQSRNMLLTDVMSWFYVDVSNDEPQIISSTPVFDVELNHCLIQGVSFYQNEVFSLWKGTIYSSIYTSTGEICIKKMRSLLSAEEATQIIKLQSGKNVADIYPVELYSHSAHKFIGVCWAVKTEDDGDCIFWHPVCLEEGKSIVAYPVEDVTDHFINVNETAVIGGDTFRLFCNGDDGYYFKKVPDKPVTLRLCDEQMKARIGKSRHRAEHPSAANTTHEGSPTVILFPLKH